MLIFICPSPASKHLLNENPCHWPGYRAAEQKNTHFMIMGNFVTQI